MRGVGNTAQKKSALRLTEFGPRMTLRLVKIEEGLCEGPVLHHSLGRIHPAQAFANLLLVKKTEADIKKTEALRAARKQLKARRKSEQVGSGTWFE